MNDSSEITDTLKAAKIYSNHLKTLDNKIQNAEHQICNTSIDTEKLIETTFNDLLLSITEILINRKNNLIERVQELKRQSLLPLEECRSDIALKIEKTNKLITEGELLLNDKAQNLEQFNQKSSLLGSLPEIPDLKEVPYITFLFDPRAKSDLLNMCSEFGEISKIAPVQISQLIEKPGAILVEWQSVENDDRCVDIQEFRLQRAFGNVISEKHLVANFSDCFIGLDTHFLVKELQANQPYSFRVCCKFEGSNEWSPWSLPQVTATAIRPYSWAENQDFILADENKIATPVKDAPCLLLSDGPQFAVDYSVEFTYLEFDGKHSVIGLIVANESQYIIKDIKAENQSYFVLDSTGEIFVDGVKKSTKLPEATKGLKICFTCELIHDEKIRVNIDSCDKRVTYYWHIHKDDKIYFAACLNTPGTKIMVE